MTKMQQMTRMPRENSNSPPASPLVDGHQPASLPPHIPKSRGEETNPTTDTLLLLRRRRLASRRLRRSTGSSPIPPILLPTRLTHRSRSQRGGASAPVGEAEAAMRRAQAAAFLLLLFALVVAAAEARRQKGGEETVCDKGWECSESRFCCNETITEYFKASQFEKLFARRNDSLAHAAGFWDYQAFIAAAALFEPRGFGTTGGREMGMKEVAAFLGHVGAKTSCGYGSPTGDSLAWGLCYNHELSPSQSYYCDNSNELYRCVEGVKYYGRGALPVYWNYNYGIVGKGIKQDLLNHPELLEQNATLAFEAAIWRWMTPMKRKQPSAHDAFVGNWKPTKKDTLSNRHPGFGVTMNILYGDLVCGQGSIDNMNVIISHYQHYLDLMGVGHEHAGDNLDCGDQVAFNPSSKIPDS